jgi:hypothetical protein
LRPRAIAIAIAEQSLSGHGDSYTGKVADGKVADGKVADGKVADSDMAGIRTLVAHTGHPCGDDFLAEPFLKAHPEYDYLKLSLRDMKSGPWTTFTAGER